MRILLLTPPFTQINTPYPATPFLKRFLGDQGLDVRQADLGLDLLLSIFSKKGLANLFQAVNSKRLNPKGKYAGIFQQAQVYIDTIESVVLFLQNRDSTLAHLICSEHFLPRAHRFDELIDLNEIFNDQALNDRARYMATLYLEELSDFIKEMVNPLFGFSRYAEKIALSAIVFDEINDRLREPDPLFDEYLEQHLQNYLTEVKPDIIAFTVPFPGCLIGALRSCKIIKRLNPDIKIIMGGGYINTELRTLAEPRIFQFVDYITLDQGEKPLLNIIDCLSGEKPEKDLLRTFLLKNNQVCYLNNSEEMDAPFEQTGWPDYSDLHLEDYLSIIEIPNPMHRLWNDGRWNKLIIAQGCYWKKCAFCDVSLSYIKDYATVSATVLVDRIEAVIKQTGQTGFHFVDEAAPPKLLKELALELIQRRLTISWWTNIRFEKNFSLDLCKLLAASGCIAVSGGLETVSDRLLALMNKGIRIEQAIQTLKHFQQAGINVHAYLMYGFPTQSAQETIYSLEIVRQLFENDLIQSGYWHRFSLTAHSDIAQSPSDFGIKITGPQKGDFAWNDLFHTDNTGCNHSLYTRGLEKAIYNYMFGIGLDYDTDFWFDFTTPRSALSEEYIDIVLKSAKKKGSDLLHKRLVWLGSPPLLLDSARSKKKQLKKKLLFYQKTGEFSLKLELKHAEWVQKILKEISKAETGGVLLEEIKLDFEASFTEDFLTFQSGHVWQALRCNGLLCV